VKKTIIKALNRLKLLPKFNLTYQQNGHVIPLLGAIGLPNVDGSEKWMTDLLKKLLSANSGTFVDVGANVGQTLLKLRKVDKRRHYIGFEPNPTCVHYLSELVRVNKFQNTTIIPAGIDKETEIKKLNIFYDAADASASFLNEKGEHLVEQKIVVTINGSLLEIDKIGFLKIDVEGGEIYVIEAMRQLIERDRPYILLEMLPAGRDGAPVNRPQRQDALVKMLSEIGYNPYLVEKNKDDSFRRLTILLNGVHHYKTMDCVDFLFAPKEQILMIKQNRL
jgi:FkbM family methyltransferase